MTRPATSPAAELQQLEQHCQQLRLTRVAQTLPSLLGVAAQNELRYRAFLETLLATEVAIHAQHQTLRVQMARFRFHQTLDEIGYTPIDQQGAYLVFQRVSRRYERAPFC